MFGCRVTDPAKLELMDPDVVFITSMGHKDEIAKELDPLRDRGIEIYSVD